MALIYYILFLMVSHFVLMQVFRLTTYHKYFFLPYLYCSHIQHWLPERCIN